jgi:hypothetical protein
LPSTSTDGRAAAARHAATGAVMWILLAAGFARATEFEKLVMPGPVIKAHADTEADCIACHERLRDVEQRSLCLECHKEVAADLDAQVGFHGRAPGASTAACRECHPDHRGRDADVTGLDPAGYDHDLTDYPLRGAHERVACDACHAGGAKHRDAPADCYSCHRDGDVHEGALGRKCDDCHGEERWAKARFDHDKTKFPLEGGHAQVACALCHPAQRFEQTANDCNSCHQLEDAHRGRFGAKCGDCHTPRSWKTLAFDHARDTRFPLRGAHGKAACESCHVGGLERKISGDCASCHRTDDVHRGRNGPSCDRCHRENDWSADTFDHDEMTKFPLRGAHAKVKCERCHTGPVSESKRAENCSSCHEIDDVHAGQEGSSCEDCHNEVAWAHPIFFEHDISRFPLLGIHAVTACEQCHATPRFKDTSRECLACHSIEDVHLRRLGPDCGNCHNPNGWERWRFDHGTQTSFQLHGAHVDLGCDQCHRTPVRSRIELSGTCVDCHATDDRHRGAFGKDCGRCHSDTSWQDLELRRLP